MEEESVAEEQGFQFYEVRESNGTVHTLLKAPNTLPSKLRSGDTTHTNDNDVFNIFMGDVSGSMGCVWNDIVERWQAYIKDKLTGRTKIYVFSSTVVFKRSGTDLTEKDFEGGGTNLTSALRTIRQEVNDCTEKYVNVFIVTDGDHNSGGREPDVEIELMCVPPNKTINVHLLGVGYSFPVNYSIDIRSLMHNGSANIPSLYWAKETEDLEVQFSAIGNELSAGSVSLTLNHTGYILPGSDSTAAIHLREWLYFTEAPDNMPQLTLRVDEEEPHPLPIQTQMITMTLLLDQIYRQWNAVFLQRHRKKLSVPMETFDLMDSLFTYLVEKMKSVVSDEDTIKVRLAKKHLKTCETSYATLMNQSKTIIGIEGKFLNEMELAEGILKTTVTNRKYDLKTLKMKGHTSDDFLADIEKFKNIYNEIKEDIKSLDTPTPDECCRITMTSTLQDLQNPDFLEVLNENKFELLKLFTMTGIPVYAPVRDSSQINPWTINIKNILVTPYTILSQRAIESFVESCGEAGFEDKDIFVERNNENSRFNVIVPIIPAEATGVLKRLVRTNLYSLMATFCILKNPHIIDVNAHIAALGCTWVKSISHHPPENRPGYIKDRLRSLDATAKLYMDRNAITQYLNVLVCEPKQALMTESTNTYNDRTMKCESLIKPMFFIHLEAEKFSEKQTANLLNLLLSEFIGRCLSNIKNKENATPFTDFFAFELRDPEKKKAWLEKFHKNVVEGFKKSSSNLLETYFTLDDLRTAIKKYVSNDFNTLSNNITEQITIALNMNKMGHLKNLASCGDVRLSDIKAWAMEMQVPESTITAAYDERQLFVHVCEALKYPSSRERLGREPDIYEECFKFVKKKVTQEAVNLLQSIIFKEVEKYAEDEWRALYTEAHKPLVMPISPHQVIEAAQARNVQVTEESFLQVYRYDKKLKLVRNACQIPGCPHYLIPHRNFNQHISVEREISNFPHALHLVSHDLSNQSVEAVVQEVASCSRAGRQDRRKPSPIEPSSLDPLCDEIQVLLKQYKENCVER
ncbi:hypothetical protein Pmani_026703 [Petrolisthes manimaculis]|uniref:VWFA domain-containing protein n=1 Tax=Petrolisthes manimaculis TaxID=1843537 RepID=A0AAE1P5C4_9EUCA|nr:hypothetical protein Pmani_026703 [Petrolisthes manimaculis]